MNANGKRPSGLRAKGWTSPEVLEGLRLVSEGMTWRAAADQAGCNPTSMWAARERMRKAEKKAEAESAVV